MRRRGRTRSSSRPPPALHYLSLVCSLGLSPRLPFAHSPRASTLLSSLQPCGASRLRTSRTASPRPGSPPPVASGSPRGHVPCLCLIAPEIRVHAAGGRITRRCSRLARACSSALRAGKRAPAAERHPLGASVCSLACISALWLTQSTPDFRPTLAPSRRRSRRQSIRITTTCLGPSPHRSTPTALSVRTRAVRRARRPSSAHGVLPPLCSRRRSPSGALVPTASAYPFRPSTPPRARGYPIPPADRALTPSPVAQLHPSPLRP